MVDNNHVGNAVVPDANGRFSWGNGVVSMVFDTAGDEPVRLSGLSGRGMDAAGVDAAPQRDPRPIVEVLAANTGSHDNRLALIATVAGSKLRFTGAGGSRGRGFGSGRHVPSGDHAIRPVRPVAAERPLDGKLRSGSRPQAGRSRCCCR